jgi:hypothetical protein
MIEYLIGCVLGAILWFAFLFALSAVGVYSKMLWRIIDKWRRTPFNMSKRPMTSEQAAARFKNFTAYEPLSAANRRLRNRILLCAGILWIGSGMAAVLVSSYGTTFQRLVGGDSYIRNTCAKAKASMISQPEALHRLGLNRNTEYSYLASYCSAYIP